MGTRGPLLFRKPGVVRPGTWVEWVVTNLDTFQSALAMLGVPIRSGYAQYGRDFTPHLRGHQPIWDDMLFGQYDPHNVGPATMCTIRTPQWKLGRRYRS